VSGLSSVGYFLITTLFSALTFVLWARLFIRYFAVSTFHPFSQTIYKLTTPAIAPIQKNILRGLGARSRIDLPCLSLLACSILIEFMLINMLFLNQGLSAPMLLLYTMMNLIIQPCNFLFYAIIIRTLMSWFVMDWRHPVANFILAITEPLLKTIRHRLPPLGMVDLSPFVAIITLKVISIFAESMLPLALV
jgi:YggT family protein